ncbi:MAG TPA: Rieske (2Fe-2S) protein [Isosphaeraceae bacterium]|jgi:Rieske Fe-S protein|nr:Rieske (2Fe-2S) protein [Isosphaeraceae bacterium]
MQRREFHRIGTVLLGAAMGLVLAVPGVAYVLSPVLRDRRKSKETGGFQPLARLHDLEPDRPKSFPVIEERRDAWVLYPREPVGSVWLIRQKDDSVLAFSAECPHLGCAVGLGPDGRSFFCPCHTSSFDLSGKKTNAVPPRGMDALDVEVSKGPDPMVSVRFQRFRIGTEERKPLG